jgi:hypothetical protein
MLEILMKWNWRGGWIVIRCVVLGAIYAMTVGSKWKRVEKDNEAKRI